MFDGHISSPEIVLKCIQTTTLDIKSIQIWGPQSLNYIIMDKNPVRYYPGCLGHQFCSLLSKALLRALFFTLLRCTGRTLHLECPVCCQIIRPKKSLINNFIWKIIGKTVSMCLLISHRNVCF